MREWQGAASRVSVQAVVLSCAILLTCFPPTVLAQASLPFSETFDYATGNLVGQGSGLSVWTRTGAQTAAPIQISAGSLSYAGLPAPAGGKITLANGSNYEDAGLDLESQTTGTVYASFIVNVINPGTTTGDAFFHFSSAGTGATDYHALIYAKRGSTASKVQLGIRNAATDSTQYAPGEYDVGVPILLVVGYTFGPGTNDDVASLWINPAVGTQNPSAPTVQAGTNSELSSVGRLCLRQGQSSTSLNLQLDEIRISTFWADVTLPVALTSWVLE